MRLRIVIAAAALTLVALLAARPRPVGPITSWTGDDLALTTAWALGVLWCIWLVGASLVCELGLRTRRVRLASAGACFAPAFVRRLAEVAIVGSCVIGSALPAGASARHAIAPPAVQDEPVVRSPAPIVHEQRRTPHAPVLVAPAPRRSHLVRAGDNLWRIARGELVARGKTQPDDATIARYWQHVIAANRTTLRSGNPNLIFPGELVALPEPG